MNKRRFGCAPVQLRLQVVDLFAQPIHARVVLVLEALLGGVEPNGTMLFAPIVQTVRLQPLALAPVNTAVDSTSSAR